MSGVRKVDLSEPLRARLSASTTGTGGYQSLVHEIQKRVSGSKLAVDDDLVARIEHYAFDFGRGGWQQLLRDLLAEIESQPTRT